MGYKAYIFITSGIALLIGFCVLMVFIIVNSSGRHHHHPDIDHHNK